MGKIVLLGYMGSGKSVVGLELAKKRGIPFLDLDHIIEQHAQKTIAQLFEQGEIGFRKLEHELLVKTLDKPGDFVLSLGGGTPCYANNHMLLQQDDVQSVYLKTPIAELVNRLLPERAHRPLIASIEPEELPDFIGQSLFERSYYYNHAKQVVDTGGKSLPQIVSEIETLLV